MTRLTIDYDDDGAYAIITRPGQAAERVELTHRAVGRLLGQVAEAWLSVDRSSPAVDETATAHADRPNQVDKSPPHFIGALGE